MLCCLMAVSATLVEAKINFTADGGPVAARLNSADNTANMAVINQETAGDQFTRSREVADGAEARIVWKKRQSRE
jgi:hypothetical protein